MISTEARKPKNEQKKKTFNFSFPLFQRPYQCVIQYHPITNTLQSAVRMHKGTETNSLIYRIFLQLKDITCTGFFDVQQNQRAIVELSEGNGTLQKHWWSFAPKAPPEPSPRLGQSGDGAPPRTAKIKGEVQCKSVTALFLEVTKCFR